MRHALVLALIVLPVLACSEETRRAPALAEARVAEAVIGSWHTPDGKRGAIVPYQVVYDRLKPLCAYSSTRPDEEALKMQAEVLRRSAKDDPELLEAVNDFILKADLDTPTKLIAGGIEGLDLQPESEVASEIEGLNFWDAFKKRYPRSLGFGEISRVGLSQDGTVAVIAHAWHGGWLAGFGKVSVFELRNGSWERSSTRQIPVRWIS